jgi:hypothetical protein
MLTLLWCFEMCSQKFKFFLTHLYLAEVKTNSELSISDVTSAEFVEVTEELSDTDALFGANFANTSANIFNIFWCISDNLSLTDSWSCLRVIIEAVVVILTDSEQCSRSVDLLTEVNIVYFINITFIHVTSKN